MAGVLERVFPLGTSGEVLAGYRSTRFSPMPSTFILGPAHCNKSALLMQAAISEAAADGQVLYIAPQKLQGLPPSVDGMPHPSSSFLENVRFLDAASQLVNAARILSLAQESAEFCSNSPDCRISYPCCVLASWTLGTGSLKKDEIKAFAKTWCHYVWSVERKAKNQDSEEFHLVEEEQGRTCIVEFSLRLLPSPNLLLHQVILEEKEQGVAAKGT
ncbi:uncharacterized protein LOC135089586 isoform X2 [Scylla paramamosain]|uniref:uncharacterized protein LOC135089586 isoform X2 n=1 Tax=Scylla paramamosain TaxID=85552 RepID=UPI003083C977